MTKPMSRFEFSINVSCACSRHVAKRLQELFFEALEDVPVDERVERWQMSHKLLGMSVAFTPVKEGTEKDEVQE